MNWPFDIGSLSALALYVTWKDVIPRIRASNGNAKVRFEQQVAIFEEIRQHMGKTNEALAILLDRSAR